MVYFKLEFGFGRGKRAENSSENGRKSDDFHLPGELAMPEKRGWDFVAAEVERARQEQRYKIAQNYLTAARSWTTFLGDEDWRFSDMNAERLEEYQRWLVGRNLCMNTISAYMRALRAMYRRVSDGEDGNPFAKVFTGRAKTAKRSITQTEMLQLKTLPLQPESSLAFARDIFLFSFYAMGMPFVDIAYLKKAQVQGDSIHYARHKTGQRIEVALQPAMLDIIRRYERGDSEFVFPILSTLSSTSSAAQLHHLYTVRLRQYNYSLHRISQMMGLPKPLSSYVVRHSWASLAYQHHLDISLIGKALGHTKSSTTFIYIKSLFDVGLAEANQKLMSELGL